jgi:hypothetical protein
MGLKDIICYGVSGMGILQGFPNDKIYNMDEVGMDLTKT